MALAARADVVAIDAPFGWPVAFSKAVSAYADGRELISATSDELRYRETDRVVMRETLRRPLSVSSDLIAVPAMRTARLLLHLGPGRPASRSGNDRVIEVHPAAALAVWHLLPRSSYKRSKNLKARQGIVQRLAEAVPGLGPTADRLLGSDDLLDAVIAAIVARAFELGLVAPPTGDQKALAEIEGWIWLPTSRPEDLSPASGGADRR